MDGVVRRFVTINADHTPWGTSVMAKAMIAVFVNATIPWLIPPVPLTF
jgi:hypothetical protein